MLVFYSDDIGIFKITQTCFFLIIGTVVSCTMAFLNRNTVVYGVEKGPISTSLKVTGWNSSKCIYPLAPCLLVRI